MSISVCMSTVLVSTLCICMCSEQQDEHIVDAEHPKLSPNTTIKANKQQPSSAARTLQHKQRLHAAIMQVELIDHSASAHDDAGDAVIEDSAAAGVMRLYLWPSDVLSSVVEVDRALNLTRVDSLVGLLFGAPAKLLHRKSLKW